MRNNKFHGNYIIYLIIADFLHVQDSFRSSMRKDFINIRKNLFSIAESYYKSRI